MKSHPQVILKVIHFNSEWLHEDFVFYWCVLLFCGSYKQLEHIIWDCAGLCLTAFMCVLQGSRVWVNHKDQLVPSTVNSCGDGTLVLTTDYGEVRLSNLSQTQTHANTQMLPFMAEWLLCESEITLGWYCALNVIITVLTSCVCVHMHFCVCMSAICTSEPKSMYSPSINEYVKETISYSWP